MEDAWASCVSSALRKSCGDVPLCMELFCSVDVCVCTVNQNEQYFNLNVPRDLKHGASCVCFTLRDKDFSDHDTLGLTTCRD